jgi:hypothetical protein
MNPRQMQQMVQKAQRQMEKMQEELANSVVEGSAGGGAVTITMSGQRDVKSITISPDVVDPEDVEMLQDLLMAAINDARTRVQELQQEKMGPLMGGMNMPGLF